MGLETRDSGQTPLDDDEKEGLLIETVSTRGELDEFEQKNIEKAVQWTLAGRFKFERILTEQFVREVHHRMFNDVWAWAGQLRKTNKNIGVDWTQIPICLRQLLENCRYWIDDRTFSEDEIAVRFSHGLVQVHPFANGNGRHSRLCGDIMATHGFHTSAFTWGGPAHLSAAGYTRKAYLDAIRKADNGDWTELLKFARAGSE